MPPGESGHDWGITQFAVTGESVDYVISRKTQAVPAVGTGEDRQDVSSTWVENGEEESG
jgi:hypothetical protein